MSDNYVRHGYELVNILQQKFEQAGLARDPIMAIDPDGKIFYFKGVWAEHHADADGSYTTWVQLEEY